MTQVSIFPYQDRDFWTSGTLPFAAKLPKLRSADASASVGLGAGAAPGGGGAPAPGRDDLVVGLLTQLLARFPPVVPQGAPGVPPVAEVQHVAADVAQPRLWVRV
ncbi:unnamed protein product [Microthlaspi erraticum]|uniref:Uncharacterized protein n=1 Tax=Microthlaspi erraticum TaxID=1685480 RepID=A0A6D2HTY6_9BRAS|nr:unnamed protein product [Microthlaspi erraticum]